MNLLFVGMIGSSFYALQTVGVGMVTVWKNLSNVVTAVGDVAIYKKVCAHGFSQHHPLSGSHRNRDCCLFFSAVTDRWGGVALSVKRCVMLAVSFS